MMRILIIDDNRSITNLISTFFKLKKPEYELRVVNSGVKALQAYSEFKPDVITLDLAMPVMGGYEFLTRIRKEDKKSIIIIVSSSSGDDTVKRCLNEGADGFIEKPFKPEEILAFINKTLESRN